ncbi:hypothetical protein BW727_100601 [Jeotgalibaca dankookensis]|uniref:Uncharacterized protein n=1 Tax=Jeotgalibaca dankookensis TaxID=708126 RepID=A0A1S6IN71_9LACT|nr:hypothetical protein [Jeotgalibaca dankookensis]AQS52994.1 hypothetical protein BW727_100601 [Jeotgalibaca dankookensis]
MELWPIIILLLVISSILLVISFFVNNNDDGVLAEVAEYTLQMTEEIQALKTRITQLEKNLGTPNEEITVKKVNDITKKQVLKLYENGKTFDEIADQLTLPETTVELVIDNHQDSMDDSDRKD